MKVEYDRKFYFILSDIHNIVLDQLLKQCEA